MSFRLQACDFSEALSQDRFFDDKIEPLPGGWFIEVGQLREAREGKPYTATNPDGIDLKIEPMEYFPYYYEIWENFHYFGLPHGNGWINELPWLVNFIKMFQRIYQEIESFRIERGRKFGSTN